MSSANYYTNPAFCQKSEFYNQNQRQRALSPQRVRQPPVGAQTTHHIHDTSTTEILVDEDECEEQEFYEEMLVDDVSGVIKEKKVVVISQNNDGKKYYQVPTSEERTIISKNQNQRYEYIQMQEAQSPQNERLHRYALIDDLEEETNLSQRNVKAISKSTYALVPVHELSAATQNRYEYITDESPRKNASNRYEYVTTPSKTPNRYEYIDSQRLTPKSTGGNPVATQKLHELLSTPRTPKRKVNTPQRRDLSPQQSFSAARNLPTTPQNTPHQSMNMQPLRQNVSTPIQHQLSPPQSPVPMVMPKKPRAQQKLNYAIGARQLIQSQDKRVHNTAIVAPICSSPIQSVYSDTTYSKSESWMNLSSHRKSPAQATMAVAAMMMLMCGGVTTGLCFYMISLMGRLYYLDFSIVAGFTCFILGLLGFRSRNVYWLPNRNYISGYIVLSFFSLLTCTGLLVLLVVQPRPGTAVGDITSAAVCGISVLSLALSATGVVASYCCRLPPPDNRVQHCAQGFTV